jgi:tetratricopeptide (TPR) repeat protein
MQSRDGPREPAATASDALHAALARARGLLAAGRHEEAEAEFLSLATRVPDSADAWLGVADARLRAGRRAAAADALRRTFQIEPAHPAGLHSLGRLLYAEGRLEEALEAYRHALAAAPGDAEVAVNLASALLAAGSSGEAGSLLARVLAARPDFIPARIAQARLLDRLGRFEESLACLEAAPRRVLVLELERSRALRNLGRDDEAKALLEALVASSELTPDDHVEACFGLGEVCERLGDYDAAFAWFRRGNERKAARFDAAGYRAWIDRIASAARELPAGRTDRASPVFIVGMPRSGTTLLERMLGSHAALAGVGELTAIGYLTLALEAGGQGYPECLPHLPPATLAARAADYRRQAAAAGAGDRTPVDKMWQNFEHLALVRRLFPGARVVHCRRHPLDAGLSCYTQHFFGAGALDFCYSLQDIAAWYREYDRLMNVWHEALDPPLLEVRYERLVADPERELRRALDFLGLDFDPACLDFHRAPGIVLTASYAQVRRPVYAASVGRWRRFEAGLAPLTDALADVVEAYERAEAGSGRRTGA